MVPPGKFNEAAEDGIGYGNVKVLVHSWIREKVKGYIPSRSIRLEGGY